MKTVAVIFGGRNPEHNVSIRSAEHVVRGLLKSEMYEVIPIYIPRSPGPWYAMDDEKDIYDAASKFSEITEIEKKAAEVDLKLDGSSELHSRGSGRVQKIDVVFAVTHGLGGEDGVLQGVLAFADIPFVGPGVEGSALAMDKAIAKTVLAAEGIEVAKSVTVYRDRERPTYAQTSELLGSERLFIKPSRNGSSVGVSSAASAEEFEAALDEAFLFDAKVLVEEAIEGVELECAVMGYRGIMEASEVGEITPPETESAGYSFDEKYDESSATELTVPARIPSDLSSLIQETAIKAAEALDCEEMARVDFFYSTKGRLVLNEINTIPGFTSISMYPKLFKESGVDSVELLIRLVESARKDVH